MNKLNLFKNSSVDKGEFLKNYWHKKPLLIRNAINESDLSILPNKSLLQQLSQHEDIQSRIAIKNNENDYTVEYGPFELSDFEQLENCRWNLLVSDIDKWHPISTNILKYFNFIRNWIFDDIMLSCGSRDGTVGPHTDHYDVFLIQVSGQRQWSFTHNKILNPELMPDQALKLMSDFNPDETIQLNPGDVLYLPPEVGHYGIASNDECVTCSIGMRTPSHAELLTSFVDCIAQKQSSNDRFEEPLFSIEPKKGEITAQDINRISSILKNKLESNNANISQWFGKYITEYRSLFYEFNQQQNFKNIDFSIEIIPSPFTKSCYIEDKNKAHLFINGENYHCSLQLAQFICDDKNIPTRELQKLKQSDLNIVKSNYENGSLIQNT